LTKLIRLSDLAGATLGFQPELAQFEGEVWHFEGQLEQINPVISWSRPRSKFKDYFAVMLKKVLDKMVKS